MPTLWRNPAPGFQSSSAARSANKTGNGWFQVTAEQETPRRPKPMWLVECSWPDGGSWTLVAVSQATGICPRCKKSIFGNLEHRA